MINTYVYGSQLSQKTRGFEMYMYSRAAIRLSFTQHKNRHWEIIGIHLYCQIVVCETVSQKCAVHENWITARGKERIQRILIKKRLEVSILIGKEVYFPEEKNTTIKIVSIGRGWIWALAAMWNCAVMTGKFWQDLLEKVSNTDY